ncbi:MAG: M43 family zinc metalloprotease [Crocinitomicaceae bacterium]
MKLKLLQVFFVLIGGALFGQTNATLKQSNSSDEVEKCSQHIRTQQMQLNDPARFATINTHNDAPLQEFYSPSVHEKATGVIYTIPVVFHILHNNGSENISDAQVQSALDILNRDYRRLNSDANSVASAFTGMPSDVEIEFAFAKVAPNGTCFDGITRTQSTLTNNGSSGQNQVNAIIAGNDVYQGVWPHNKYLNIYVANSIGGAAGYTFLPNGGSTASATNMYYNGIFVLENYTGAIGTSNAGRSRTLTHEVGHWLNLPHVWGGGNSPGDATNCNIDDGVQDTPNTKGSSSCTLSANTCNSDDAYWGGPMIDNVENYMDYSYCSKMFTQGQVDKMRTAIVSNTGGRSNIWTTTNLQNVGVLPGVSLCSIDFAANQTTLCSGTTITYTPNTTSGISNYSWSFPGGTPSTSNAVNPTVTYNTVGNHNATLVITSSGNGLDYTQAKTTYITVNSGTTVNLPINEGFTTAGTPAGWVIINTNGSGTWVRTTAAGLAPTAGNSFMFDNYNINDGTNDEFQITKFSTLGMSSSQITFDVAYAPYDASNFDGLEVLVSTDCGATFSTVYSKSNTVLATRTATTSTFTPTAAQWRGETIDLTSYVGESSVLVAFRNLAGYGNRLFIDNVNITGVTAVASSNFNSSSAASCIAQTVTFTDASTAATSWNWNFGSGAIPATATGVGPHDIVYSTGGTKTVTLTVNGGDVSSQSLTITAPPSAPSISAGGLTTFCAGGSVVLTSSASSGNVWSNGATTQSIAVSAGNSYTVTTNNGTCTSAPSSATVVTVNSLPAAPTASAGGPISFCSGGSVVLTSSTSSGNFWSNGATTSSITVTNSGNYSVTANNGSCTSINSNMITVDVTTTPPNPAISAGGATTFCSGSNIVLTSSATSNNLWSNGATTQSITVTTANSYTVTAGNVGCSATSSPILVTVNPLPTVTFGALSGICIYNSPITLTGGAPAGGTYSGVGVSSGIFNPTTAGTGNKTITYTYTDGSGCSNSQTSNIVVDGCLSIDEANGNAISVYPNPSNGAFTLNSDGYILNSVAVYNQIGQLVYNRNSDQIEKDIYLMNFESGVYTIRVKYSLGVENIRVILSK